MPIYSNKELLEFFGIDPDNCSEEFDFRYYKDNNIFYKNKDSADNFSDNFLNQKPIID